MVIAVAIALVVAAAVAVAVTGRRVRQYRQRQADEALAALVAVARGVAEHQHRAWMAEAEAAVVLSARPGAFDDAVRRLSGGTRLPVPQPSTADRRGLPAAAGAAADPGTRAGAGAAAAARADGADGFAVGGVAAVAAADWWTVDAEVLAAVGHMSHESLENVVDLWSVVGDYRFGEKLFQNLRGHVGEQTAAEHLAEAGLSVQWPEASNEPGWDLDAGGHAVNVKVTADAGRSAAEHFERYPQIPVVVNGDAANIPDGAVFFNPAEGLDPALLVGDHVVIVDQALSLSEAAASVEDALNVDALHGDMGDTAIPGVGLLVTVVRSGVREGRLLHAGDTDAARAAYNVTVDVVAKGVGIIAGAKAGAAAGAAVDAAAFGTTFGAAAAVGAIAGAFGGSKAGGKVATHFKHAKLREARQAADEATTAYSGEVARERESAEQDVRVAEQRARAALAMRSVLARRQLDADLDRARDELAAGARFDPAPVLAAAEADLRARCDALDPEVIAACGAPDGYARRAAGRGVDRWRRQAVRAARYAGTGGPADRAFWDAVSASPAGRELLDARVREQAGERHRVHAETVAHAVAQTRAAHDAARAASAGLRASLDARVALGRERLEPAAVRLAAAHDAHLDERRRAGLPVPAAPSAPRQRRASEDAAVGAGRG